jgi:ATP-dependent DNA helicase PIF1
MVDGKLFDKLEEIGRLIRDNILPFGGIQIVVSGDFAQLPPVPDRDRKTNENIPAAFAFEASSWHTCISHHVVLRKVFRQRDQRTSIVRLIKDYSRLMQSTYCQCSSTSLTKCVLVG